ncbi:tetratricopeptide repeat protein [Aquimarina sp. U1-2]|uniref:tetratricopeptide repeat protein n=1 Tax=Aquimarina sp. U1-2 TaxID=2823141 RepID=UPI001AEC792D|nr:tetratricopeptide repeat protein [Aquimarina sp. U1-2]MBP2834098.1 tetratricopeptide repeat protein [Aquimarina sp. U1-2]
MKHIFTLSFLLTLLTYSYSQQNLQNQKFVSDSILYQQLLDSVKFYRSTNQNKAEKFLNDAEQINNLYNNERWEANIYKLRAIITYLRGGKENLEKAITLQKSELLISERLEDSKMISGALNNLSILYSRQGDYPKAAKYAIENINLHQKAPRSEHNQIELGQAYARIGDIYLSLKLIDSSLINHQRAYDIFKNTKMPQYYNLISSSLVNLGYINHYYIKDYEKALMIYTKAYEECDKSNIKSLIQITILLGEVHKAKKLYDKALIYYHRALDLYKKDERDISTKISSLSSVYIQISENYLLTSQPDSTIVYVDQVLEAINTGLLQNIELEMLANDIKSKALEKKGDSLLSLTYFKKSQLLKDSLERSKNIPKTTEVLLASERNKLIEKEKNFFDELNKRNLLLLGSAILVVIILIISFIIYFKKKKKITKLHEKENKLVTDLNDAEEQRDYLNRQITTSSAQLAIKNDLLYKIDELLERLAEKNVSEGDKNTIRYAQDHINDNLELDKMWDTFFTHFEKVHPQYIERLKDNYNLSMNELRLCAFLRMNLSYKEIGQLINITQSSLHVTVHRLKKKFDLPKEQSVFDFLHSFSV